MVATERAGIKAMSVVVVVGLVGGTSTMGLAPKIGGETVAK